MNHSNTDKNDVVVYPLLEKLKEEVEKLRNEFLALVIERDELNIECKNIEMEYMLAIGVLELKIHELECRILYLKREIEMIQAVRNLQKELDLSEIEDELDTEFEEYKARVDEQAEKVNEARERSRRQSERVHDEYENYDEPKQAGNVIHELKKLYRAIMKKLHPDVNPDVDEAGIRLIHQANDAYEDGDIESLRMIMAMIDKPEFAESRPDDTMRLQEERARFIKLIQMIRNEIAGIKSKYPYTMKSFLKDPEKIAAHKAQLGAHISELDEALAAYSAKITEMMEQADG